MEIMNDLWKVEFHCHTVYSRDSLNWIHALVRTALKRGLDKIMVTDHNTIRGAIAARLAEPDLFVVGEEIKLDNGAELLAYYVQEEIPAGLPFQEVIQRLRTQGSVIGLPHPLDRFRGRWHPDDLAHAAKLVDAVEGFNARSLSRNDNYAAEAMAAQNHLPVFAGSDAHLPGEVGTAYTVLPPFHSPDELVKSLQQAKMVCKQSSNLVHLGSRYAVLYKLVFAKTRRIQDLQQENLKKDE